MEAQSESRGLLDRVLDPAIAVVGLGMTLYFLVFTFWPMEGSLPHQNTHLGFGLTLAFLVAARMAKNIASKYLSLTGAALSIFATTYVRVHFYRLEATLGFAEEFDLVIGVLLIVVVLWSTWRHWGLIIPILSVVFILYFFFGHLIPGALGHPPMNWKHVLSFLSIGVYGGIYGTYMVISADWIFPFMIYGALLVTLGGGRFFSSVGVIVSRYVAGGAGQMTTISSTLVGMITGSAVASASFGGSFTIPAMKKNGYSPVMAGAIEATTATGAQIMPPVLGAAAFIMAMFLNIGYWDVVMASWVPAGLYFLTLVLAVRAIAIRNKIPRMQAETNVRDIVLTAPLFIVPLGVIIFLLMKRFTVTYTVEWALFSIVFISLLRKGTRPSPRQFIDGIVTGAKAGAAICVIMATVGMLAQALTTTGLGVNFTSVVEELSFGSLPLALVWTAIISLILGCGVPTVAAYVLVASVTVPLLSRMGALPIAAHMFALYYAILSQITPPVAGAAMVTARIAGAGYMRTGWEGSKMAIALYILPFLFVYNTSLLAHGEAGAFSTIVFVISACFFCFTLVAAFQGVALKELSRFGRLPWLLDTILFGAYIVTQGNYILLIAAYGLFAMLAIADLLATRRLQRELQGAS